VFHYIENMSQRLPAQIDRILRPREQEVNYGSRVHSIEASSLWHKNFVAE